MLTIKTYCNDEEYNRKKNKRERIWQKMVVFYDVLIFYLYYYSVYTLYKHIIYTSVLQYNKYGM